jgi:transposase-like protein
LILDLVWSAPKVATPPAPVSPLKPTCPECRLKLQLVRIVPHPDHAGFDQHEFVCHNCGKTRTYTLRRKG